MKKLIFFIAFVFCFLVGKAQFPITQSIGSPTTLVQVPANGGFRAGIINRTFTDTTAANLTYLDAYQGAQIFTTSDAKFWVRNATATGWIDIAGSGSSSQRISALLAANQTNTIDNANYEQLWRWNSLSGKGLRLNSTTTLADEGQNLLEVSVAGANAQAGIYTYGINVSNSHTGGGINVAANFAATGGSSNYAALFTSGNVGIGTSTPAASSLLDITSTSKGFLPPRMTGAQQNAISSPATGLMIYNTDSSAYCYYTGSVWLKISQGSGSTPTWQQTLDAGGTLDKSNTIDVSGFNLTIQGAGEFAIKQNNIPQIMFRKTNGAEYGRLSVTGDDDNAVTAMGLGVLANHDMAVSGSDLTAFGAYALNSDSSGYDNTAIGGNSLQFNKTGHDNTAVGVGALNSNISGNNLLAFGINSGRYETRSNKMYLGHPYNFTGTDIGDSSQTPIYIDYDNYKGYWNQDLIIPSYNVGIGTSTPAKILHTVGTVRHETLGTASSDTTTNKPLGINSSGDIIPMTYWPGGAGGGITSLNGLSGATQTFATGTSGSDFAISSVGTTHTFNIPTASGSNRGLLSTSDWTTFSNKVGGSGVANQISYWNGSSSLTGDADMTYNSTTNTITMLPNGTDNGQINFSTGYGRTAIMLYDGGAGVRHGWGLQPSEMQFFNPTAAHFSWNLGGDLQTSGTNEIMRLYSPGSMAGQLNLRDPNGTYSGLTNNGGPLTIFGSSTYNDVQVSVGSSTAIRAYHPTSFNYIYLNGQVINNDLTVLSNYVGAYSLQRTVPYAVGGDNYHGYTDNTDFRLGTAAFNSFGSFVTFGNNTTNADHYAAFQNVWKKDSSNTMSKVYGFVNAVSEITGGAITDLYGYYHYSPTITSGTITNQYGIYIPTVTGATNNYGAYIGSNVGIGITTPATKLHVVSTTEQFRLGYDGSNYFSTTVGSSGGVTLDAVGSGSRFTYSDGITLPAGVSTATIGSPLKFTTGTSLSTAEAGAMEYSTPQLFFTNGAALRQELFQGNQNFVQTLFDKTSSTTLGDVTNLSVNVAAGKAYRFEAILYTSSNVAGGVKAAISGTATATTIIYEGLTTDAGLTTQSRATSLGTAVGAVTAVTAGYIKITGTIIVNAAGTLTVQFAQNASNGSASSVLVGSTFHVIELAYFP